MTDLLSERFGLPTPLLKDAAELGGKAILVTLTAAYGIGLLIINFDLRNYGIRTFDLVRAEYLIAGLSWFAITGVAWAVFAIIRLMITPIRRRFTTGRRVPATILGLTTMLTAGGLLFISVINLSGTAEWSRWQQRWIMMAVVLYQAVAVFFVGMALKLAWRARYGEETYPIMLPHNNIPMTFIGMLAALVLYAQFVYPQILPMYGGGHSEAVQLVLSAEGRAALKADALESAPVYVLAETNEWLLVSKSRPSVGMADAERSAVRVRQNFVLAVRFRGGK